MDITPHKGISFSTNEASKINSLLSMHKVRLDPGLVGGYKLLNQVITNKKHIPIIHGLVAPSQRDKQVGLDESHASVQAKPQGIL